MGILYFFLLENRTMLLVFLVLHTCLTLAFFFISQDSFTKMLLDAETVSHQVEDELRLVHESADEIARLKDMQNVLLLEKETAEKKIAALEADNASLQNMAALSADAAPGSTSDAGICLLPPPAKEATDLDIIAAARQTIEDMSFYSLPRGIQLVLSSSSDSLNVRADKNYINILFRNIIDNSIKYMNRNGSLVITISSLGDDLLIVLKDNGNGLSLSETAHIFELNYQGSNRVSGNGLGLPQVKAIVEHYGGTIYAKSGPGKGMAIYIQLPASVR